MDSLSIFLTTYFNLTLVSKLVSNKIRYVSFRHKKSYKKRKTTAKAVIFMVAEAGLEPTTSGL